MKSITRVILAVALALAFATGVNAQDTCRVKVRIAAFNWDNSKEIKKDFMSPNQTEWWLKDGQKKFSKICFTQDNGQADYVIAWTGTQSSDTYTYSAPTKTETTNSTVVGDIFLSGTSTKTTYETKQGEWPVVYVNAFVYKMSGTPGEKIPPPIFITKHKGQWRWSKPDKDSFVKSLEFINKQLK